MASERIEAAPDDTIEIENIAANERLIVPYLRNGGVVEFTGVNGAGKSWGLAAINNMATGDGKLPIRDGATKGRVSGLGMSVTFGRSTRRTGELEVETLDSQSDIGVIIDPKIKDAQAADARRIKALLNLARVTPKPDLFYGLLGGKEAFEAVVKPGSLEGDDVVQMSDRIKRDIESAARDIEAKGEHAANHARAAAEAAAGVDLSQPCDAQECQQKLEAEIRRESRMREQARAAEQARKARQAAMDAMEDAEATYSGLSVQDAEAQCTDAAREVERTTAAVAAARIALQEAERTAHHADSQLRHAVGIRDAAQQHERIVSTWRKQLNEPVPESVSAERICVAQMDVEVARKRCETAVLVRRAMQHLADAEKYQTQADALAGEAAKLREAARGTEDILADIIAGLGTPIRPRARDGVRRLVIQHKRRGEIPLGDCSPGERGQLAVDFLANVMPAGAIATVDQEIWASLDPKARRAVTRKAVERRICLYTAIPTEDSEVGVRVYGEE